MNHKDRRYVTRKATARLAGEAWKLNELQERYCYLLARGQVDEAKEIKARIDKKVSAMNQFTSSVRSTINGGRGA